ncbi:unnamed protein product [Rhizoctonia solani]|uniref:Uncharacterized protein n=2 Tax=Rhizoctonia solani TaxID=456999 RepID=A0A8H3D306_9AGAM
MPIDEGQYYIQSFDNDQKFVGTGPLPPVHPLPPAPLRTITDSLKDVFELKPLGGDNYILTHKIHHIDIGYDQNHNVSLLPLGDSTVVWAINRGNGEGRFRIKLTDSDKYWTATDDDSYAPIELHGSNGSSAQEWKFEISRQ